MLVCNHSPDSGQHDKARAGGTGYMGPVLHTSALLREKNRELFPTYQYRLL